LALLSNAPEPPATAIDRCHWTRHFTRRLYSCRRLAPPSAFGRRVRVGRAAPPAAMIRP
jgi:hypothetical protein